VHQFQLGGKHYLFLPKLNTLQIELLDSRFSEIGIVRRAPTLAVSSRKGVIRVSEEGLCWSSFDPSDAVLPAIPALLSCPREEASMETVKGKYFRVSKSKEGTTFHILPRLESSSRWRELRASDGCALAPDEHAVVSFLVERARGNCEMITDFLVDGSTPLVLGRRRYFDSRLDPDEATSTLRVAGERGQRNSYIPRNGRFDLSTMSAPSRRDWSDLFADLGEWCSFTPF
jgi:hypothetical protein